MRSIRKITVACLAIAIAAGLGIAADAGAKKTKKRRVASHIAVQFVGPDGFKGRVKSKEKACRSQRLVTLYRVNSGPSVPSSDVVTTTYTRSKGNWTLPSPQSPGQYFAQVKKKTVKKKTRKGRKAVICRGASSNVATWG